MDSETLIARKFLYFYDIPCLEVNKTADLIADIYNYSNELELIGAIQKQRPASISSESEALQEVIASFIDATQPSSDFFNALPCETENGILQTYQAVKESYARCGLALASYPEIKIVDRYPQPFSNVAGAALAPDATDRERYNIPYAIYIRRDAVDPIVLPVIIAHELAHYFVIDDGLLARGLEEGLAEFLAFFVVAPGIIDKRVLFRYFLSKRITPHASAPKFRTYLDYVRIALFIYTFRGMGEVVRIINEGRACIKDVELQYVAAARHGTSQISSISDDTDQEILSMAWGLVNNHPMFEILSVPSYYYIYSSEIEGRRKKINISTATIFAEIERNVFGCIVNSAGEIEFDDFPTLRRLEALRFTVE